MAKATQYLSRLLPHLLMGTALASAPCLGAAAASAPKPLIEGLVSMGDTSCIAATTNSCTPSTALADAFATPGVLRGYVVNVTWAELQPGSAQDFVPTAIDAALATAQNYNQLYPHTPIEVVLRVGGGAQAPNWVKTLDGPAVQIALRSTGAQVMIGRFWTANYQTAWRGLQAKLAARYDANPLVAQISDTSCAHQSDEPYVNPVDSASIVSLYQAGYTNQAYATCLLGSVHDYDAWTSTRVDFSQNPFENLTLVSTNGQTAGQYGPADLATTTQIMGAFRQALGIRAILANHDLVDPLSPSLTGLYSAIAAAGRPITFQTQSPGVPLAGGGATGALTNWAGTVALGVQTNGDALEVWSSKVVAHVVMQDGWNAITACPSGTAPLLCAGQPLGALSQWTTWLETGIAP